MIRNCLGNTRLRLVMMVALLTLSLSSAGFTYGVERVKEEENFGWSWNTPLHEFKDVRHIADIDAHLSVYSADLDLSPLLGEISVYCRPRLIFEKNIGLVQVRIPIHDKEYDAVEKRLAALFGERKPIIYEMWSDASVEFIQRAEWLVGKNTKMTVLDRLVQN